MIRKIRFTGFKSLEKSELDVRSLNLLIGANAAGKSNVIRGFRFLSDAIRTDVESAVAPLGGLEGASFWGRKNRRFGIEIEYFVPDPSAPHSQSDMSYSIEVGSHEARPAVLSERLSIKRQRNEPGRAKTWLSASLGKGTAIKDPQKLLREPFDTGDAGILALKALGFLETYPRIRVLRRFIESWQFLTVNLEAIRAPHRDQRADTLDFDAGNLVNVLRTHSKTRIWGQILEDLKSLLGMIEGVSTSVDRGRVSLLLKERAFKDPVEALSVSDGTLRLLALITGLHLMPKHGLLCVEEPEHGVHPLVFGPLLELVRERCPDRGSRQVMLTTHSPDLVDAAEPQEVITVERDDAGRTSLGRPDPRKLTKWIDEFRLGELWRMRQLGGVPR